MNFEVFARAILVILNSLGLLLAWWVLRSASNKKLKFWYVLMTVFMLSWANFSFLGSRSTDVNNSVLFYKLNWGSVSLFLVSFYFFYVVSFLKKGRISEIIGVIIALVSLAWLAVSLFTNLVIQSVAPQSWGMEIIFGPLGDYFNIYSLGIALLVVYYSLHGFGKHSKQERDSLKIFLAGVSLFIVANIIFNVISQIIFKSVQYQILGDFSSILLLAFTVYASVREKLFSIQVVTTEATTTILVIFLLSRVFISETPAEMILNIFIFLVSLIFGYLLTTSVTKEIEQNRQLEQLTKRLKELDQQKDEFLNVAAHELRAPMTAIKGYLSMINDGDAGKVPRKMSDLLNEAVSENNRLIRLVNNLLDISRIEEGRLTYEMGTVSLSKVVHTSFANYKSQAKEKNLKYNLEIKENINDQVYVDVDRIYEVIDNLISNAIKYTDRGSVTVRLISSKDKIKVEVEDTGRGISKKESEKIFTKFYRADSNINKKIGTGLGLYICKLLIEYFKGDIGFSSKVDKGSTFWFELPLQKEKNL